MKKMSAQININNPSSQKNGDDINLLPVDENPPSHEEIEIVEKFFKQKMTTFQKIMSHTKDVLIVGILFILFSLTQIDDIIVKFIPSAQSPYILLLIKAGFFMLVYFILKNWYLSRKHA